MCISFAACLGGGGVFYILIRNKNNRTLAEEGRALEARVHAFVVGGDLHVLGDVLKVHVRVVIDRPDRMFMNMKKKWVRLSIYIHHILCM